MKEKEGVYLGEDPIPDETETKQIAVFVRFLIKKYKLKGFKKILLQRSVYEIEKFGERFKDDPHMKEMVICSHGKRDKSPVSYFFDGDDYKIFADNTKSLYNCHAFVFIYNEKKFVKDFYPKIKKVYYEKGNYSLINSVHGYYLSKIDVKDDDMPILNGTKEKDIMKDIETFFSNEEFYRKYDLPYKRGILIWGPPGGGKTLFVRHLLKNIKGIYGILVTNASDITPSLGEFLKEVLNGEKRILILEDIDGVESYHRGTFLNFLDGIETLDNTLIIATTNFPEKLDIGIVNRPSRFDRIYHFGEPNESSRSRLLKRYFPDLKGKALTNAINGTKGFSGAYFKELFITKNAQKVTLSNAIESIKTQLRWSKEKDKDQKTMFG